ncbi:MAG: hypothetical protein EA394_05940 [Bacteroidia bacterium]|nr:MAG: hypothetical protein EA394_05940 [Bacteroidia bacterium]
MLRKISFFWFILLIVSRSGFASPVDTVSVMVYNLLFYGHYTSFCTPVNNNVDDKDEYLKTIIDHTLPDIFAVNEMGPNATLAQRILNNVMNTGGRTHYAHATYTNTTGSNLVNMLFYNSNKFQLYDEAVVANVLRDINLYTLYYNDPELAHGADTLFMHVLVAHLKAGSSASDQQTRMQEIGAMMGYIEQKEITGNVLFMGDFNMNSSFEQAYQLLTWHPNAEIRFYDPVDQPGVWWNNPDMAPWHTQSTRVGSHDCFVTGGMDDRYDQIIVTNNIMEGTGGLHYLANSYTTIGQDGLRFNNSLINPPNQSEPPDVISALFNMSDHLPVKLSLAVTDFASSVAETNNKPGFTVVNIPGKKFKIILDAITGPAILEIFDTRGTTVDRRKLYVDSSPHKIPVNIPAFQPGIYLVRISIDGMTPIVERLIVL